MEDQEQTVKVKVQTLTQEAFRPYGQALESKQPIFPEVEPGEGRVAIEMQKMKRPVNPRRISGMAIHFSYNQTFIPVRGTMALIVAPPPRNRDAGHEKYELDYERIAAFFVEPGQRAKAPASRWKSWAAWSASRNFVRTSRSSTSASATAA